MTSEIPYGYCQCGRCGQKTDLYRHTDKRTGAIKGEPRLYLRGHGQLDGPDYIVEDLGYETPCWIWRHGKNAGGYGRVSGPKYAHQIAYERAYGPVPAGKTVDHLCHNADENCPGGPCKHRRCVNPEHLKAKPHRQNVEGGRVPKLTREQVRDIRSRPKYYGVKTALAREFGVHPTTIGLILNHPDRVWPD